MGSLDGEELNIAASASFPLHRSSTADTDFASISSDPSTTNPSNPNNVSFHRRARELYRYFHPLIFEQTLQDDNNLLTSQAQLVALYFHAHCMITFLDNSRQYIAAEAGSLPLTPPPSDSRASSPPPAPAPPSWFACRTFSNERSLCRCTMEVPESDLPFFEVPDLVRSHHKDAPSVTGAPFLRYYCGTPLFTKAGIAIGAVVLVDRKPRKPISHSDKRFLRSISQNCVKILELNNESKEQKRTAYMNACLSRFINPSHETSFSHSRSSVANNASSPASSISPNRDDDSSDSDRDASGLAPFPHAAKLLREALGPESSGVVFLDTVAISSTAAPASQAADGSDTARDGSKSRFTAHGTAPILASSFNTDSAETLLALDTDSLIALAKQYPTGQTWTFDGDTELCSDSALQDSPDAIALDADQWKLDGVFLSRHFPQASCIFVKPFWNARSHRTVILLAFSTSMYQTFTPEHDIPFINAFCNCVTVDLVRLSAVAANRQKEDFIGSISHELRSPLHGILASCDLLGDTTLSSSQQSLVETANSCGRTLLDTISMVLDWSKVNSFERNPQKVGYGKPGANRGAAVITADSRGEKQLLPNLYGNVDLATIVEEVVEVSVVAQAFQSIHTNDFADLGAQARGRILKTNKPEEATKDKMVEVFVDIQKALKDWVYITMPGSFRRLLMNLVGNSLKYTANGWVKVSMKVTKPCDGEEVSEAAPHMVTVTVEDTGQGISQEYLQTKLFSPFAQENVLAPGTGLGLSLAKSIIDILDGEIHIESVVGRGTKITIAIPMQPRDAAFVYTANVSASTTPSTDSSTSNEDVRSIKALYNGQKLALFYQPSTESDKLDLMRTCLHTYLRDWFDLDLLSNWKALDVDLILVNDFDVDALVEQVELSGRYPPSILVFCTNSSRFMVPRLSRHDEKCNFYTISKPFGPHRLAKCLQGIFRLGGLSSIGEQSSVDTAEPEAEPTHTDGLISPTLRYDLVHMPPKPDFAFNENSVNAALALSSLPSGSSFQPLSTSPATSLDEFPFPGPEAGLAPKSTDGQGVQTHDYQRGNTQTLPTLSEQPTRSHIAPPMDRASSDKPARNGSTRAPRLMLVDDNSINLKLLTVYMKKLKYTNVTTAMNGQEAADLFKTSLETSTPPDVIFMDLSMPVLDGFDSTRAIRAAEKEYLDVLPALHTPSPAFIIALSGLASDDDQKRAFEAGVDLYMTKPASFKEVGTLLHTWEANGGIEGGDKGPHGALTGDMPPAALGKQEKVNAAVED